MLAFGHIQDPRTGILTLLLLCMWQWARNMLLVCCWRTNGPILSILPAGGSARSWFTLLLIVVPKTSIATNWVFNCGFLNRMEYVRIGTARNSFLALAIRSMHQVLSTSYCVRRINHINHILPSRLVFWRLSREYATWWGMYFHFLLRALQNKFVLSKELWGGEGTFQTTVSIAKSQSSDSRWKNLTYQVQDSLIGFKPALLNQLMIQKVRCKRANAFCCFMKDFWCAPSGKTLWRKNRSYTRLVWRTPRSLCTGTAWWWTVKF